MNTINLVLGDWSHDGHGKSETVTIETNLTVKQIANAYKKGSKKIGFDLTEEVASEYEDSSLPIDVVDSLNDAGFDVEKEVGMYNDELDSLDTDNFVKIYLFIVGVGAPSFKYKIVHNVDINIGGYGLFS